MTIGEEHLDTRGPNDEVGRGKEFSPAFFNVGSISIPLWDKLEGSASYAVDGCTVIHGRNVMELNENIQAPYN